MSGSKETSISQAERLRLVFGLTEPAIRRAVLSLGVPEGSHGLDAGCGAGNHLELLARQVGPTGRLVALDLSSENLAAARAAYGREGIGTEVRRRPEFRAGGERPARPEVEFVQGDICRLPFKEGVFDWVWCADTLWAGTTEAGPATVVAEFARVTRPGGKIALVYWSSQTFLPGYPGLEARLNEAFVRTTPYLGGIAPESHYLRALTWLRKAGLKRPRARTFPAEVKTPTGSAMRETLAVCFDMFWGDLAGQVAAADWEGYRRLCDPDSPDFIADDPDYYAFITYTMFSGTK
jgi:ubiquinone/menaquinone biosynthesis C-methylase UbiE